MFCITSIRCDHRGIERRNPRSIFLKRHLYSSLQKDGSKVPRLEEFYSAIESDASRLFDDIARIVEQGELPVLDNEQKDFFVKYFLLQHSRLPDVHAEYLKVDDFRAFLKTVAGQSRTGKELKELELEIDRLSQDAENRIKQNAKVQALSQYSDKTVSILLKRNLVFLIPADPKHNFIIGSNPQIREAYGATTYLSDDTGIVMPISRKLAIGFGRPNQPSQVVPLDRRLVQAFNLQIAQQSSEVAGPSDLQLQSLISPR